jgi:hypothetical protein
MLTTQYNATCNQLKANQQLKCILYNSLRPCIQQQEEPTVANIRLLAANTGSLACQVFTCQHVLLKACHHGHQPTYQHVLLKACDH